MYRFRYQILLPITVILCSFIYAQEDSTTVKPEFKNSLKPGVWAIQFAINDSLDLKSFQGKNLSVKRQLNKNWAIRVGIDMSASLDRVEVEPLLNDNVPIEGSLRIEETNDYSFLVSSVFQRYLNSDDKAVFYWGAGPAFGLTFYDFIRTNRSVFQDSIEVENVTQEKSETWRTGMLLAVGGEYFLKRQFSFFAEYSTGFFYSRKLRGSRNEGFNTNTGTYRVDLTETRIDRFTIVARSVTLGLSLYF